MKRVLVLLAAVIGTARAFGGTPAQATRHTSDIGRFVVTRAILNPGVDPNETGLYTNDPRLVGRIMTIEPDRLAIAYDEACPQVRRTLLRTTIRVFLSNHLSKPDPRRHPARSLWSDPDLKRAPTGPVDIVRYECTGTGRMTDPSAGQEWSTAFGFPLAVSRRALSWSVDLILVLEPLSSASAIRPSFACSRTHSLSELTICRDPALAGLDRSVTEAYRLARDGGGPDGFAPVKPTAALVQSQQRWLRTRDACGTDRQCLAGRMMARTGALMQRRYAVLP